MTSDSEPIAESVDDYVQTTIAQLKLHHQFKASKYPTINFRWSDLPGYDAWMGVSPEQMGYVIAPLKLGPLPEGTSADYGGLVAPLQMLRARYWGQRPGETLFGATMRDLDTEMALLRRASDIRCAQSDDDSVLSATAIYRAGLGLGRQSWGDFVIQSGATSLALQDCALSSLGTDPSEYIFPDQTDLSCSLTTEGVSIGQTQESSVASEATAIVEAFCRDPVRTGKAVRENPAVERFTWIVLGSRLWTRQGEADKDIVVPDRGCIPCPVCSRTRTCSRHEGVSPKVGYCYHMKSDGSSSEPVHRWSSAVVPRCSASSEGSQGLPVGSTEIEAIYEHWDSDSEVTPGALLDQDRTTIPGIEEGVSTGGGLDATGTEVAGIVEASSAATPTPSPTCGTEPSANALLDERAVPTPVPTQVPGKRGLDGKWTDSDEDVFDSDCSRCSEDIATGVRTTVKGSKCAGRKCGHATRTKSTPSTSSSSSGSGTREFTFDSKRSRTDSSQPLSNSLPDCTTCGDRTRPCRACRGADESGRDGCEQCAQLGLRSTSDSCIFRTEDEGGLRTDATEATRMAAPVVPVRGVNPVERAFALGVRVGAGLLQPRRGKGGSSKNRGLPTPPPTPAPTPVPPVPLDDDILSGCPEGVFAAECVEDPGGFEEAPDPDLHVGHWFAFEDGQDDDDTDLCWGFCTERPYQTVVRGVRLQPYPCCMLPGCNQLRLRGVCPHTGKPWRTCSSLHFGRMRHFELNQETVFDGYQRNWLGLTPQVEADLPPPGARSPSEPFTFPGCTTPCCVNYGVVCCSCTVDRWNCKNKICVPCLGVQGPHCFTCTGAGGPSEESGEVIESHMQGSMVLVVISREVREGFQLCLIRNPNWDLDFPGDLSWADRGGLRSVAIDVVHDGVVPFRNTRATNSVLRCTVDLGFRVRGPVCKCVVRSVPIILLGLNRGIPGCLIFPGLWNFTDRSGIQ